MHGFFVDLANAIEDPAQMTEIVGVVPKISEVVDTSLYFTDSDGKNATLSEFLIPNKPTLIVPVYYECPRLCGLIQDGLFQALKGINLEMGSDYNLIFISFDPLEGADLAAKRKAARIKTLEDKSITDNSFRFLVGSVDSVKNIMNTIGFHYKPDGEKDFAHSAAVIILTPAAIVSHYFTGIEYVAGDLRLAMIEASEGKLGTFVDKVLLYCFRFDPTKGKYTWVALNVMKAGGVITLLALGLLMGSLWLKEWARR